MADIYDFCRIQARDIARLQSKVKALEANASPPPAKSTNRKMSLATRGRMSASWTAERRAAQGERMSKRMRDYWHLLDQATQPAHPNGNGGASLSL